MMHKKGIYSQEIKYPPSKEWQFEDVAEKVDTVRKDRKIFTLPSALKKTIMMTFRSMHTTHENLF